MSEHPANRDDQSDETLESGSRDGDGSSAAPPVPTETYEHTPSPSPAGVPQRIGQYRIKRAIASGGMGTVYEAVQEKPRRTVAVKLMRAGIASRSALRRFEYESQLLARLRHNGIAQVYDAGTHRDGDVVVPYFAMEYIVGARPITDYADREELSTRQRLELFVQVCEAVHHGHQKGIIHRDLKPSNILVDSSGQVKVIDFGVARSTDSDMAVTTLQTNVGQLLGTLQYMSPEQCAADPHDIDTRSDVYALGVILYELLCGQLPYDIKGTMIHEATRVVCDQEPVRLSTLDKTLRGDVETIVFKALEKNRNRRYQSASALVADIGRYLNNEPISARPASAMYQFRKLVSRHKVPFAFIGVLFLLICAFGVWMSVMYAQADHLRQKAVAARASEEQQRKLAEKQADELKTITQFQQSMLSDIDAQAMGRGIVEAQRDDIRKRLTGEGADAAAVEAALSSFSQLVGKSNPTDLALKVVDEFVLARAVKAIEKEFADKPVTRAALQQTVAKTYRDLGLYDAAMPLQEAALKTRRKELGDDHPDTLASITEMGGLFASMGKYAEAEPYFREALEGNRRVLGDNDPETLASINNMGVLLNTMGKRAEAEPYYREVLEASRRILGVNHPRTLISMGNMGGLLRNMGRYAEAEPYFRKSMEGLRRVLGDDNPATLNSIALMGHVLQSMGRFAEAEPYFREALEGRRRVLGDDHIGTLSSVGSMGRLLTSMGKYEEAEPYCRKAMEGFRRVLGDDNTYTLTSINDMGILLNKQGRYDEAAEVLLAAEPAARRLWTGDNARWLGDYLTKLGEAQTGLGKYPNAEATLLEAHELLEAHFGGDQERNVSCVNHLITLYESWNTAEPGKGYDAKAAEWRAKLPKEKAKKEAVGGN